MKTYNLLPEDLNKNLKSTWIQVFCQIFQFWLLASMLDTAVSGNLV
jgi:hypothetical protein